MNVRAAISALRRYWTAVLLGLPAVVLFILSAVLSGSASTALVGAGSALAGAAATRIIDLAREHRAEAEQAGASRRRDLDETRRVAYMALVSRSAAPELVATVMNALAHHGLGVDPDVVALHLQNLVAATPVNRGASESWLREQIDRITAELG